MLGSKSQVLSSMAIMLIDVVLSLIYEYAHSDYFWYFVEQHSNLWIRIEEL